MGSSSRSKATRASVDAAGVRLGANVGAHVNNPGAVSSSSAGRGQSCCSSTTADHNEASSSSTSPSGGCP